MKAGILLMGCFLVLSSLLGGTPNDTIVVAGSPSSTQESQGKQQVSDARIIPGTHWAAEIVTNRDGFQFCNIWIHEASGERVVFTVGSLGSLALLIEDEYLERQISSCLPWLENGQSYRAILFLDDKKFNVSAIRRGEHALLVELKSIDTNTLLRTQDISLAVGSIAMRSYKVEGLGLAIPELLDCGRQLPKAKQDQPTIATNPSVKEPGTPEGSSKGISDWGKRVLEQSKRESQASTRSDSNNQRLTKFTNQKYGCAILVPLDVFPNLPQQPDDEHTMFLSTDRRTMLELVVDQNHQKRAVAEVYREWIARCEKKGAIGYKTLKGNWFVVSGDANGRGYYTKCVGRDNQLFIMNIEYDEDADAIRENTMTTMSRNFTGRQERKEEEKR